MAEADPVEEVLLTRPTADAKAIEHVSELIKTHGSHPKICELRYYRTGQLMGSSQEPAHLRSIIKDLEQLEHDAGTESDLAFRCKTRIGEIYYHCLKDKQAAYTEYKGLEQHPSLAGHTLGVDVKRTELYVSIAEAAFALKKWQEVENYTRMVMAYPYLGMEDRVMYQRFYDLYDHAGRLFVGAFSDNPAKLLSVEIYPSHPVLYKLREKLIAQEIGVDEAMSQLLSPEEAERSLERAQADMDKVDAGRVDASPTRPVAYATTSQPRGDGTLGTASEDVRQDVGTHGSSMFIESTLWIAIASGIIAVVGMITVVHVLRRRRTR